MNEQPMTPRAKPFEGTGDPDRESLLDRLLQAHERGAVRALDVALARFIAEQDPASPPSLWLATALLSHLEGLGHSCLDLRELAAQPQRVLAWPADEVVSWLPDLQALPREAEQAWAAWSGAQALGRVSQDPRSLQTPLVLEGPRLYLRRYAVLEARVAQQLTVRATLVPGVFDAAGSADSPAEQAWLDLLFPAADTAASAPDAIDWQRRACERALRAGFTLITGGPGTGKTHTAARLLFLLHVLHRGQQPLRVGLAAPTGKAAARLRQAIDTGLQGLRASLGDRPELAFAQHLPPASTLHALLGVQAGTRRFRHNAARPLPLDLLLVDEASMVHLDMMDALLQALAPRTRLVLLGDSEQLASVEAGSVLGELRAAPPGSAITRQTVVLRQSHRFAGSIGQAARAVNEGDAAGLISLLGQAPDGALRRIHLPRGRAGQGGGAADAAPLLRWILHAPASAEAAWPSHANWLQRLRDRPRDPQAFEPWASGLIQQLEAFRVLCALREGPRGVSGLNELIEREASARGWLQRSGPWYEGRPIMVTRNDPALRLFNGDIGLVLRAPRAGDGNPSAADGLPQGLRACFLEGQSLRSIAVARLPEVQTAFAMTVHKSQGSEFDHVMLVLPDDDLPVLTRELLYTGITRARRWLSLAVGDDEVLAAAAARRTWRMSGLAGRL